MNKTLLYVEAGLRRFDQILLAKFEMTLNSLVQLMNIDAV